jgi:hypothetical protein
MNIIQTLLRTDAETKARLDKLEDIHAASIEVQLAILDEIKNLRNDISKSPQQRLVVTGTAVATQPVADSALFTEDDLIPFIPKVDTEELTLTQKEKPKLRIKKGKDFLKISENLDKN